MHTFTWDSNVIAVNESKVAYYYFLDNLGSPIRTQEIGGNEQNVYDYNEFGLDLSSNKEWLQPVGYTGYQFDNVSNVYFAQAREYYPEAGRFMAEDIIKGNGVVPSTVNQYIYCGNQPVDFIDLNGMDREDAQKYMETYGSEQNKDKDDPAYNPNYPVFDNNCTNFVS